ncbi:hypothetical protein BC835DRAFT_1307118 [Cytidiella melzeri]|nr:hypothetical protein BC835DRAFT_1307118 [Cytidiella melzeri]
MVQIIDFMASLQMDTATFLHYLSWNLEIPGCMVHEQSVMRCVLTHIKIRSNRADALQAILHNKGVKSCHKSRSSRPRTRPGGIARPLAQARYVLQLPTEMLNRESHERVACGLFVFLELREPGKGRSVVTSKSSGLRLENQVEKMPSTDLEKGMKKIQKRKGEVAFPATCY